MIDENTPVGARVRVIYAFTPTDPTSTTGVLLEHLPSDRCLVRPDNASPDSRGWGGWGWPYDEVELLPSSPESWDGWPLGPPEED